MKNRHRKHRETGGRNDAAADLNTKPMRYTADSNVNDEAEEKKRGGRAKKKEGGMVHGEAAKAHAGRKPRKSGGSATSNPFSSARQGAPPAGRKLDMEME